MKRIRAAIPLVVACVATAASAGVSLYDDGKVGVVAEIRPGIFEPPVPIYIQGQSKPAAMANVIEVYDLVPGTGSYPLTVSDVVANTYLRSTYQRLGGTSAPLTTSVVAAWSLRTPAKLDLVPTVHRVDFATHALDRFQITTQGTYDSGAKVTSTAGFPDPVPGRTTITLRVGISTDVDIPLAVGNPYVGNDRLRMATLSTMWASPTLFDTNLLRFEDALGGVHLVPLSAATAQSAHLFAAPIPVGRWVELVKTPGSTWQPDSPSIRLDIVDSGGLKLGVQGFHLRSSDPNDDSLTVWLEVIDAPDVITAGTRLAADFAITAFALPEPGSVARDFNGDGSSDIVWTNTGTGDRYAWFMVGTALAGNAYMGTVPPNWKIVGTADFDGDGHPDILWHNDTGGEVYVWRMKGTTFLGNAFVYTLPTVWQISAVGDFNADGKPDIVWTNTATGERYVWLMNGTAIASSVYLGTVATNWRIVGTGDFDGDGKTDILWHDDSGGAVYVWLMNGTTLKGNAYVYTLPTAWQASGAGDFNGDGKPDILWTNTSTGERFVWLMNGSAIASSASIGTVAPVWTMAP